MNRPLLWILGFACAVIVFVNLFGIAENQNPLKNITGENKEILGIIDSIPTVSEEKTTFILKLYSIDDISISKHFGCHSKVQVTCTEKTDELLNPGDILSMHGEISLAESKRNPGGFNYAIYLRGKGIDALCYVNNNGNMHVLGHRFGLKYKILGIRTFLSNICDQSFSEEQSAIIKGMLLGEKDISDDLQEQFSDAGISHLLAISGLHVGYICIIITWMTSALKCGSKTRLTLLIPSLIFYCILTGCSASVIRAAIMTAIPVFGDISHRHYDAMSGLCLSAILILCVWPAQLFSAGFQLSFCAVFAIILFFRPLLHTLNQKWGLSGKLYDSLCLTFCATIGTFPAMMFHYHTLNLVSLISNLIMVPLAGITMIVILICLPLMTIISGITGILAFIPGTLSQLLIDLSAFFASLPGLKYQGPSPGVFQCLLILIIIFALSGYFNLRHLKHKQFLFLTITWLLTIIMVLSLWPKPLSITFLDVGQGDCALIETPNGCVYLIDGGGYEGYRAKEKALENPISEKVLLPALYAKGITHIDGVFITHNHSDHAQGIEELLTKMPVNHIYLSTKYNGAALLNQNIIPVTRLFTGTTLSTNDGCTFEILWPDQKIEMIPDNNQNNASLVLKLRYGQRNFLFTGDAGIETEEKLNDVSADVIKIGHHGSANSTSLSFLSCVSPRVAVISVGQYNTYGHPTQTVLNTITSQDVLCYRTDQKGAIVIKTNGENLKLHTYLK